MTDILFDAELGVEAFPALGDLGNTFDARLLSGASVLLLLLLAPKFADNRGGGCTDLAFELLVAPRLLLLSSVTALRFSIEDLADSSPVLEP